jgi:GRAM domain-containing protein
MNKKNRFGAGLIFGIVMTVFYLVETLLTSDNLSTNQILKSLAAGLLAGVISGFLFGWLIGLFAKSKFVTKSTNIETQPNENILLETPANHFKGIEAVGGKLYLTNKRLIFKSHKLNVQNHQLSLKLTDIKNVNRFKNAGFLNNGLSITTMMGNEKFVVEQIDDWIKFLNDKNGL